MKKCQSCKQALPRHLKELCPLCIELALSCKQKKHIHKLSSSERLKQKLKALFQLLFGSKKR